MLALHALAAAVLALPPLHRGCGESPLAVLRAATQAVAGDSVPAAARRWRQHLARDAHDRSAVFALATLARLTDRAREADSLFARLARTPDAVPDACTVWASLGRADLHMARGEFQPAQAWYGRAETEAVAARDSTGRGRALLGLSASLARTEGTEAAARALDRLAVRLAPSDSSLVASYRCERAGLVARMGGRGARAEARAGAALAHAVGDARVEARCRWIVAVDYVREGDLDAAGAVLDTAEALLDAARHHSGLASLLQWHGYLAVSAGRYGDGRALLQRALAEAQRSGNASALAWAQLNLTQIALAVHDLATADRDAALATASFRSTSDGWGLATAMELSAQIALAVGDTARARALLVRMLAWATHDEQPLAVADAHLWLADLALRSGTWTAAERELAAGRAALRRAGGREWEMALEFYEGIIALRRGRPDDARRLLAAALASLPPRQTSRRYVVQAMLAEATLASGDTAGAEEVLRQADAQLDAWRATLADEGLRLLAFQVREPFGGRAPAVQRVIAAVAARGRTTPAFALAEQRRARELRDQLTRAAALRERTDGASRGAGYRAGADSGRAEAAPPMTLADVQRALPDGRTALLEYVAGPDGQPTTLFVVCRGWSRAYRLTPVDSLRPDIARFAALLQGGAGAAELARRLGGSLLSSALADLPAAITRLVIVPDDALYAIPFQALALADGRRLIERYSVAMEPSAAIAGMLWRRGPPRGSLRLLALGDPAGTIGGAELPSLPESGTEVRRLTHFARDADVRTGRDATRRALESAARSGVRVIHIAAHALVDPDVISRTRLQLAPGPSDDGTVWPGDLAALQLDADLVVLSACRTAAGPVLGGEGVRGLTAPLLLAGARAVVASDWPVSDRSTTSLMTGYYDALARGLDAADALRDAGLQALREGAPPRDWAAFRLVGDPAVRVPFRRPGTLLRWWWSVQDRLGRNRPVSAQAISAHRPAA